MLRTVYQNPQRWLLWALRVFLVFGFASAYSMRGYGRHTWISQLFWVYWGLMGSFWARQPLFILTDDLLVIHNLLGPAQRIPLVGADVKPAGRGWLVSWKAGKFPTGQEIRVPAPFVTDFQAAIAAAKAAGPRNAGVVRASHAAPPLWYPWAVGGAIGLVLLGFVINEPLLLVPCYALGLWSTTWNRSYLLVGDQMLILAGDHIAANIPVGQVKVSNETTLLTPHPQYPRLRLPKKAATTPDFLRDLRAIQSGTLAPYGQPTPHPSPPLDGPRCTLCGARLDEAPLVAANVSICPACAVRTRFEAAQSGHGFISAKPRPPM